ncbi:MAG TPA: hypothetical protein VLA33_03700 [Gemmatimonadota bacterium]|nr:hypothetical protein [Gemmatimonadota bacterium]
MFESVVTIGDKLHVFTRSLFEGDVSGHFVGAVVGNTGSLCEVEGHAMMFDAGRREWVRQEGIRRRIFSLAEAGHVVTRLPRDVEVDDLYYDRVDGELLLTDGKEFELNLSELGPLG